MRLGNIIHKLSRLLPVTCLSPILLISPHSIRMHVLIMQFIDTHAHMMPLGSAITMKFNRSR